MELAYIPSPSQGVWHVGPVPIRAYALCILAGIAAAMWLTRRRWVKLGGNADDVIDICLWAVPFGIVGGRLYHVITDPELYFKAGEQPIRALYIWDGGLGIWGAVALGAVGAWIGCRRKGIPLSSFADVLAPGLILAQGIGRWGNYFNQELYGDATTLPWGLKIDKVLSDGASVHGVFQPTFLYESLWDFAVVALLLLADRRWSFHSARLFALYVLAYTAGRGWIESLRSDPANMFLGIRLNDWTSMIVFLAAAGYLVATRKRPEPSLETRLGDSLVVADPDADADGEADADAADAESVEEGESVEDGGDAPAGEAADTEAGTGSDTEPEAVDQDTEKHSANS
jgi:prolipoprotein diacylglyceryl transferase